VQWSIVVHAKDGDSTRSEVRERMLARQAKHPVNPSPQKYSTLPKFGNAA
jgi:hypothetical protein